MNIPIANIYYLLCYAWDKLEEGKIVDVNAIDPLSLSDLFARVLINGTNHLVRRGFDRGYVPRNEWTTRIRGKVRMSEMMLTQAIPTGTMPCDFDELEHDVLHNQILRATLKRLVRTEGLGEDSRDQLRGLLRLLAGVSDIELTSRVFSRIQLHRNNLFYDFLMKICELIYNQLLIDETNGRSRFKDFVQDEQQMAELFESFVHSFYAVNTGYAVKRDYIRWQWTAVGETPEGLLPRMETDVSLTAADRKIIIECKFTPKATQTNREGTKLRSSHLYQLNAYLENLRGDHHETCRMILLYPTAEATISADYEHRGRRISIRTINLNQHWQQIHEDLMAMVA